MPLKDKLAKNILASKTFSALGLGKLLEKANMLNRLNDQLIALLPPNLGSKCRITSIDNATLIILTKPGSHVLALRMDLPNLQQNLTQLSDFKHIQKIRIRVQKSQTEYAK